MFPFLEAKYGRERKTHEGIGHKGAKKSSGEGKRRFLSFSALPPPSVLVDKLINLFIYIFIYIFIYLFIYLFIYYFCSFPGTFLLWLGINETETTAMQTNFIKEERIRVVIAESQRRISVPLIGFQSFQG